jgi:hypothetical protein
MEPQHRIHRAALTFRLFEVLITLRVSSWGGLYVVRLEMDLLFLFWDDLGYVR